VKWLLFLQEFDFKVVYKLNQIHFVPGQLSQINHGESPIGIKDQLPNAILFTMGINWYGFILEYLQKGYFENDIPKEKKSCIIIKSKPYTLYDKVLYKLGPYIVLWQCLSPTEAETRI
jgi:hypothetical protein